VVQLFNTRVANTVSSYILLLLFSFSARISAQYAWIKQQVCDNSISPPASFDCGGARVEEASMAMPAETEALSVSGGDGSWTPIVEEHFTTGFGLFEHPRNNANHYLNAMNRGGVVRIEDGNGGHSELTSNLIPLENTSFSKIKVIFSFYAVAMEHADGFCLDYVLDNGAITGERCWNSLHAFQNHMWYDDMSLEFDASNARNLWIRFRIEGDDDEDDVLLDSVTIHGQA